MSTFSSVSAIDAIIVAIETQDDSLKKKKTWTRKMVVLTDGESPIEMEDWELTVKKIKEPQIITTIMGGGRRMNGLILTPWRPQRRGFR